MERGERAIRGCVFYADGAGGGSILTHWGRNVERGLNMAGIDGGFVNFHWQTGRGVAADQISSVRYKRDRGARLARRIEEFIKEHPGEPVTIIGLSAGTAIAVFALESLATDSQVDCVVLLGSSLSAHYDLSSALKHVRHRLWVFTSKNDAILRFLVPLSGTADREFCGACAAGLLGFHVPPKSDAETRKLYAKVSNLPVGKQGDHGGDFGGHTDVVKPRFVRDYVAPLLLPIHGRSMLTSSDGHEAIRVR